MSDNCNAEVPLLHGGSTSVLFAGPGPSHGISTDIRHLGVSMGLHYGHPLIAITDPPGRSGR
jgi:hypothetical protein